MVFSSFPASTPTLIKGDGDGTVNIRSLLACKSWQKQQKQPVHTLGFNKVDHLQILSNDKATEHVKNIVQSILEEDEEYRLPVINEVHSVPGRFHSAHHNDNQEEMQKSNEINSNELSNEEEVIPEIELVVWCDDS